MNQRENGLSPSGINPEVEAYLFGVGVSYSSDYQGGFSSFGNTSLYGAKYESAMMSLLFEGYSEKQFQQAVENFNKGSSVNDNGNGLYKNHSTKKDYKPIITKFLPF